MAVLKLVEDYAVTQLRKDVRDAMQLAGEQSVLLQLFHAGDSDALPCPQCADDTYKSPERDCTSCYGTLFNGGVRTAMKVWTIYGDKEISEQIGPRGIWRPDQREVTFEALPLVNEHDVLARVRTWGTDGTPSELEGFYMLQKLQRRSLRTGNRFGQWSWDVVSQKAQVMELNSAAEQIAKYPILGQSFAEPQLRVITTQSIGAPMTPSTSPGAEAAFVFTQSPAASVWTIVHNLNTEPSVSIMVNDEEVFADVDYPDDSTVVITFSSPQAGTARLT